MATAKARWPLPKQAREASAFLKAQGTVLRIFLPEPVGLAGDGAGVGRK